MIRRLLVANRSEIAIRAFRAAYELGITTIAVYTHEDRDSLHRLKADEAYEIGEPGHPVRAYLDISTLVATARRVEADAVYPGYGFLSESPELAQACAEAGITFVGPPAQVLALTGDKRRARAAAADAGLPVLAGSGPLGEGDDPLAAAEEIGYPVFVKAASGGGGRGLRRVEHASQLADAVATARREAEGAFGDDTVFLEKAMTRPRHIEVQLLADAAGDVIHLYERDCSVQRRHQKVIEIAPAPNLDPGLRDQICADAVRFGEAVGYRNAGTVEFLVDAEGSHVFIEMNPRIQVEHTVTEETTDVDIVAAQLQIAGGATFDQLGLAQEDIRQRGTAIQCRVTTENPANGFRPDTGVITAFRSAAGAGIRLDAGSGFVGAKVSPYFDSLLVKVTARGRDLRAAATRARRALAEFRVRGVATNVAFLGAVLGDPDFLAGRTDTSFIDDRPHLTATSSGADRGSRLLAYLADVTVNRPHGFAPEGPDPATKLPDLEQLADVAPPQGSRQRLQELGADGFAQWMRGCEQLLVTDTTLRDAHQSLLATRMRTFDMLAAAPVIARTLPELFSLEVWGGATYDVALRFLNEDPWERLARLREAIPNICLQMLLRGNNAVGYTGYPPDLVRAFVAEAADQGIDIFRVFDAFNDVTQMTPAIEAVRDAGAVAEGTLCYTGDLADPAQQLYTLEHYVAAARGLVDAGAHILCVKDMAGLLRPPSARLLITTLRSEFDLPVHLHTHDTAGGQLGTYVAAIEAGVDAVDGAAAPLSGMTSQPNLAAVLAATDHTARATGLSADALDDLEPYWEAVRNLYAPFESGLRSPTGTVYRHEIPGGQLSNLRQQALALGLAGRFEEIERLYARCDDLLGGLIKVTPSSKVVGDLALFLASSQIDPDDLAADPSRYDLPASVIEFLQGALGTPPGGWPEPFRTKALRDLPHELPEPSLSDEQRQALATPGVERRNALSRILFPEPAAAFAEARDRYGDLSVVPTRAFLFGLDTATELEVDLEPGVRLFIELEAVTDVDDHGIRTVLCALNGQTRPVDARDRSVKAEAAPAEKASADEPGQVAAPLTGVVDVSVGVGDSVAEGDRVATIEAMKMESAITAAVSGTVQRVAVATGTNVEPGDLILVIAPD